MAERVDKEATFVDALYMLAQDWAVVRGIVSTMRTLGYLDEITYSKMNTFIVHRAVGTVRSDGSETIELAREHKPTT